MSDTQPTPTDPSTVPEPTSAAPRPSLETLIGRGLRLTCPRCGQGRLFRNWFLMPERCSECGLKYERGPGYFLGSAYLNYGVTACTMMALYFVLHVGWQWSNTDLAAPLSLFCVIFPLWAFRYARALWLVLDCHIDASILAEEEST